MNILSVLRPKSLMLAGSLLAMGIPGLAAPITGVVNIGGASAAVTAGAIDFYGGATCETAGIGVAGCFGAFTPKTGSFAGLPTTGAGLIQDLQGPPFTGAISIPDFIMFVNGVHFDLTNILAGGAPDCATVNQNGSNVQCTPYLPGNVVSPFIIVNDITGQSATVSFNVKVNGYTGTIGTGFTPYIGTFSTPSSGDNIADIMGRYNLGIPAVAAYSANFTPEPVPEPGTVTLLGVGALAIAVGAYRRRRAS
jgi:hypothetical protein